jgi:hypothetical protein
VLFFNSILIHRDTQEGYTLALHAHNGAINGMSTFNGIISPSHTLLSFFHNCIRLGVTFGSPEAGSGIFISANQEGSNAPQSIYLQILNLFYPPVRSSVDWPRVFAESKLFLLATSQHIIHNSWRCV